MQIQFALNIDQDREDRLVRAIGCTKTALPAELNIYAKAALSEYVDMFSGLSAPRTIGEMREQRLLQIILADNRQLADGPNHIEFVSSHSCTSSDASKSGVEKREFETA